MLETRARIALLGGGMMAQVGHLPFYEADPRVALVGVVEERPSLAGPLAEQLGPDRVFTDRSELLDRPDVDAIVISSPRPATGPLTLEALEAGKHVLAEKPMAHTADQARALTDAAQTRGLIYAIGFMKRYDPAVFAAKALVADALATGRLGGLLLARFYDFSKAYAVEPPPHVRPRESRSKRYPTWPLAPDWLGQRHRSAYAWFVNAASHDINLLTHFFPGTVEVTAAQAPREGAICAFLRSDEIAIVLEVGQVEAGRWLEGAEFLFERGRIALSIPSPMATDAIGSVVLDDLDAGVVGEPQPVETGWCFSRQARGFVDALTGAAAPATDGVRGTADLELIEAIWRRIGD